jgi:hypothetical protein
LQISQPTAEDCVASLIELTHESSTDPDEALLTDLFRYLARQKIDKKSKVFKQLMTIPLFTNEGWCTDRPVYHTGDRVVSNALSKLVPVWFPPCRIEDITSLTDMLGVISLSSINFERVVSKDGGLILSEPAKAIFKLAKQFFQKCCLRHSESLSNGFVIGWKVFQELELRIDPSLRIQVKLEGRKRKVSVQSSAFLDLPEQILWLSCEGNLWEGAKTGRLFADYFKNLSERHFIELAWQAAVKEAEDYYADHGDYDFGSFRLAEENEDENPLEDIAQQAKKAAHRESTFHTRLSNQQNSKGKLKGPKDTIVQLVPWKALETVKISLVDGNLSPSKKKTRRLGLKSTIPKGRSISSNSASIVSHNSRPSSADLEQRALICLQHVLSQIEKGKIEDTSHLRRIGADAILNQDKRKEFFEIKSFSGPAPGQVSLTRNEAQRAKERRKKFWLVVVSGLASDVVSIRIYNDPLSTLEWSYAGSVVLKNLNKSKRLSLELRPHLGDRH